MQHAMKLKGQIVRFQGHRTVSVASARIILHFLIVFSALKNVPEVETK